MNKRTAQTQAAAKKPSNDLVAAFQALVGQVMLMNGQVLTAAADLGQEFSITPAQWQVLVTIMGQQRTVSQYARRLGIQRQRIQYTINALLERGLVKQVINPDHRRSPLISLTQEGETLMEQLRIQLIDLTRRFTRDLDLTPDDLKSIGANLKLMRQHAMAFEEESG